MIPVKNKFNIIVYSNKQNHLLSSFYDRRFTVILRHKSDHNKTGKEYIKQLNRRKNLFNVNVKTIYQIRFMY